MIILILENYFKLNDTKVNEKLVELFERLNNNEIFNKEEFLFILNHINYETFPILQELAFKKRLSIYQDKVYIRGLLEITNYCQQDCYYCGIRKSNHKVNRYRYDRLTVLKIVSNAYQKGYRTIVMQGGEDNYYSDEILVSIVEELKQEYPDIAITLSLGEKEYQSFQKLKQAGVDRYLLRHESASEQLYEKLHPKNMSLKHRIECLENLRKLNFQTGAGFMVGSPYQTNEDLVEDLLFIQKFKPEMIGIGPYLTHQQTPFKDFDNAVLEHVLVCYALVRLISPYSLIPATTATSSLDKTGRLKALQSGCNVIMINLSDFDKRQNYSLYENKSYLGDESDEFIQLINKDIEKAGLKIDFSIGNYRGE